MRKGVTLPLKLNMSSESIRMDCSFGPRLRLIFLAFHFICVALSFLFCPCHLFFLKFDHPSCGSLFNIMCTEAGKCRVPKRKRTRERVGMRHGCTHKSLRKLHSLVRGHSLRPSFTERVTPIMWILNSLKSATVLLRSCLFTEFLIHFLKRFSLKT